MIVIIQGSKLFPHECDILVEEFLEIFNQYLVDMTEESFAILVESCISVLNDDESMLSERANNIWSQLVTYQDYNLK